MNEPTRSLTVAVVGQGIAGSCVARQLEKSGVDFMVFDDHHKGSSSLVAGGMWNPVVFRKLTKSWEADRLLPAAQEFYADLEEELGSIGLSHHDVCRFFASVEEQNNWSVKIGDPGFENYLFDHEREDVQAAPIIMEYGYGLVQEAGRIDVRDFLAKYRSHLVAMERVREEAFDHSALKQVESGWQYKGRTFSAVVFCEGHQAVQNPWFEDLPLQPNKGETLTIEAPDLNVSCVLNKGFFMIPLGDHQYKVGATFSTQDLTAEPTDEAREKLENKLKSLLKCSYKVLDHGAGIRPTVSDRRPLVGEHPKFVGLWILNGLGTKGVTIGPTMAQQLVESMAGKGTIWEEANINRFS